MTNSVVCATLPLMCRVTYCDHLFNECSHTVADLSEVEQLISIFPLDREDVLE